MRSRFFGIPSGQFLGYSSMSEYMGLLMFPTYQRGMTEIRVQQPIDTELRGIYRRLIPPVVRPLIERRYSFADSAGSLIRCILGVIDEV